MMFKRIAGLVVLSLIFASPLTFAGEYKKGEIIVKYRDGLRRGSGAMNQFYQALRATDVERFSGQMESYEKLKLGYGVDTEDAIKQAMMDPMVEFAQPNYILKALPLVQSDPTRVPSRARTELAPFFNLDGVWPTEPSKPSRPVLQPPAPEVNPPVEDPKVSELYGLKKISAKKAWDSETRGDRSILVAVIDTGIDYNHEDLSTNVWRNPNPDKKNDVVGYNFVSNDGLPYDDQGHGTHTSGTIGAVGGNGKGLSGVSQKVSIMAVKFLNAKGSGTTSDAIKSIDYAVSKGAKILSNSWGGGGWSNGNKALEDSIKNAADHGVLFVVAAGNESLNNDTSANRSYPASFKIENMISVAATDQSDHIASFSNYGPETTHLAAPGVRILSTIPGNLYQAFSGTSMACPHVAGAAALVWSKNPTWDYKQVKAALLNSVDPIESLQGKVATAGRLNVLNALRQTL